METYIPTVIFILPGCLGARFHLMAKARIARLGGDMEKGGVVLASHTRADCTPFWLIFPPLQAVPSFACSVASLSRFPGH